MQKIVKPLNDLALEKYKLDISEYTQEKEKLVRLEVLRTEQFDKVWRYLYITCFLLSFFVFDFASDVGILVNLLISGLLALCLTICCSYFDFIVNLFSFGRLKEIERSSQQLEGQIKDMFEKLRPFEKSTCDYYQAMLEDFFAKNLYKKRSGNPEFEEALAEFSEMIKAASGINNAFVTNGVRLAAHEDYLIKRSINHGFQVSRQGGRASTIRDFVRDISDATVAKQPEPIVPQAKYRIAKKIDNWDEIYKKRQLTGKKGEEIVMALEKEFFESINRKDLSDKVRHVASEDGDGLGYDILSFFQDGKEKYIEVKSTVGSIQSPYYLSRNELAFLQEHQGDAFIYRVFLSDEVPQISTETAFDVLGKNVFIPTEYLIRAK